MSGFKNIKIVTTNGDVGLPLTSASRIPDLSTWMSDWAFNNINNQYIKTNNLNGYLAENTVIQGITANTSDLNTRLNNLVNTVNNKADLPPTVNGVSFNYIVTSSTVLDGSRLSCSRNILANYAKTANLNSTLESYVTNSALENTLGGYAAKPTTNYKYAEIPDNTNLDDYLTAKNYALASDVSVIGTSVASLENEHKRPVLDPTYLEVTMGVNGSRTIEFKGFTAEEVANFSFVDVSGNFNSEEVKNLAMNYETSSYKFTKKGVEKTTNSKIFIENNNGKLIISASGSGTGILQVKSGDDIITEIFLSIYHGHKISFVNSSANTFTLRLAKIDSFDSVSDYTDFVLGSEPIDVYTTNTDEGLPNILGEEIFFDRKYPDIKPQINFQLLQGEEPVSTGSDFGNLLKNAIQISKGKYNEIKEKKDAYDTYNIFRITKINDDFTIDIGASVVNLEAAVEALSNSNTNLQATVNALSASSLQYKTGTEIHNRVTELTTTNELNQFAATFCTEAFRDYKAGFVYYYDDVKANIAEAPNLSDSGAEIDDQG